MAIANYIPELWSARLLANLDKSLVIANLANTNWEGEIRNVGDTVHIQQPAAITANTYAGTVTYETPTSTQRDLVINQDTYYAFAVDDLDQVQANVNLVDQYTARAAYALADDLDQYLAGLYTDAGLTDITLDVGTDDAYEKIVLAGQQLDEANVPRAEPRWLLVTPKVYADLLQNSNFIHSTAQGDSVLASGRVGTISGFEVFMSNNVVNSATTFYKCMYGTRSAITYARQLLGTPEAIRREGAFEDAVRGRMAYGAKVVQPNALGTITADQA